MRKLLLMPLFLASILLANITEHPDWNNFYESSGIAFLQNKYQAILNCQNIQAHEYRCQVTTPDFEVNYMLKVVSDDNHNYIDILSPPTLHHYASHRLKQCSARSTTDLLTPQG